VRATLARQQGGAWQWESTVLAWLMEQAGIAEMQAGYFGAYGDRELATDLIAEAGFPAAALRQAPFRMWSGGVRGCHPGIAMPGARAQNAGALGRTNRAIRSEVAAALAALVLACQAMDADVTMREGERGVAPDGSGPAPNGGGAAAAIPGLAGIGAQRPRTARHQGHGRAAAAGPE
jgi:hypothetical protein